MTFYSNLHKLFDIVLRTESTPEEGTEHGNLESSELGESKGSEVIMQNYSRFSGITEQGVPVGVIRRNNGESEVASGSDNKYINNAIFSPGTVRFPNVAFSSNSVHLSRNQVDSDSGSKFNDNNVVKEATEDNRWWPNDNILDAKIHSELGSGSANPTSGHFVRPQGVERSMVNNNNEFEICTNRRHGHVNGDHGDNYVTFMQPPRDERLKAKGYKNTSGDVLVVPTGTKYKKFNEGVEGHFSYSATSHGKHVGVMNPVTLASNATSQEWRGDNRENELCTNRRALILSNLKQLSPPDLCAEDLEFRQGTTLYSRQV